MKVIAVLVLFIVFSLFTGCPVIENESSVTDHSQSRTYTNRELLDEFLNTLTVINAKMRTLPDENPDANIIQRTIPGDQSGICYFYRYTPPPTVGFPGYQSYNFSQYKDNSIIWITTKGNEIYSSNGQITGRAEASGATNGYVEFHLESVQGQTQGYYLVNGEQINYSDTIQ